MLHFLSDSIVGSSFDCAAVVDQIAGPVCKWFVHRVIL